MDRSTLKKIIIVAIVLLVSVTFLVMIHNFIMVILLAGIFSAMAQPLYQRFERLYRGRKSLASLSSLLFILIVILTPVSFLLGIVASQAIQISTEVKPWIDQWISRSSSFDARLHALPGYERIAPYQDVIMQKAGEAVGVLGTFLFNSISGFTLSTINTIFLFLVFLYTMFFFLKEGGEILEKMLFYLPLPDNVERRILDRFTSVTRATIKGTIVIGIIQGGLAGLAFWAVGIQGAVFWGTIMTVLSIIPLVGSALVWVPAVIVLALMGQYLQALGLFLFCSMLVGSIDNLLRPWLVGRDTELHELMVFFGTIGGISLFGIIGFIIGPIVAALVITSLDIYAEQFKEYLSNGE